MYSWSKNWPTLTELFFGKGNGPQGKLVKEKTVDSGNFPNGMTAKKPVKSKDK
jgi:hypothetical protein|tara:strand:+ start:1594 stop:1752 length:159 start_codon:yes stop_codon:yes gene_type:complete